MFQFRVRVGESCLLLIKNELNKALPTIKSSHRCEALARGLGHRTYASALSFARSGSSELLLVDGDAFKSYLSKHGFDAAAEALFRAAAKAALREIAVQYPTLTANGFGQGDWDPRLTRLERRQKFMEARTYLTSDYAVEPFLASLAFLARVRPTSSIRPTTNSYWLKHIAENYKCSYPTGEELGPTYVPNGVFIAAAIHAGFKTKVMKDEYGGETLNAGFNMEKRSLFELDCEIRPNGARAQDRKRAQQARQLKRRGFSTW